MDRANDFNAKNFGANSQSNELKNQMLETLAEHQTANPTPESVGRWQILARLKNDFPGISHRVYEVLSARWQLRKCELHGYPRVIGRIRVGNLGGTIRIGEKVLLDATLVPSEIAVGNGGLLEIGARTYINYGVSIAAKKLIRIGEDCLIGTFVNIMDDDFHGIEDRNQPPPSAPVILERNVWLGARVIVLKGVTIGHDSVIGAGSVVTKSIPPRSVAVGLPARVIKTF